MLQENEKHLPLLMYSLVLFNFLLYLNDQHFNAR